jgi:hypothetical protein
LTGLKKVRDQSALVHIHLTAYTQPRLRSLHLRFYSRIAWIEASNKQTFWSNLKIVTLPRPHIKTTNPIESTFSTIRLSTKKTRACVSRTMVYKLGLSAEKSWRKLRGFRRLADVINGVKFIDGIDEETIERQSNAA